MVLAQDSKSVALSAPEHLASIIHPRLEVKATHRGLGDERRIGQVPRTLAREDAQAIAPSSSAQRPALRGEHASYDLTKQYHHDMLSALRSEPLSCTPP